MCNITYFISNDSLSKQFVQLAFTPFITIVEEVERKGHQIKWVRVNSNDKTFEELDRYPRFVRVLLAVVFIFPSLLCLPLIHLSSWLGIDVYSTSEKKRILDLGLYEQNIKTYAAKFKCATFTEGNGTQALDSKESSIAGLQGLPSDILIQIFNIVVGHDPKQRATLSLVCKQFYRIAIDPRIWNPMLSDIGVKLSGDNFNEDRDHIICRYHWMKKSSLELQMLFPESDDFLKLPSFYLNHKVNYTESKADLWDEQRAFEEIDPITLQEATIYQRSRVISGRGWIGLLLQCEVDLQSIEKGLSEIYFCIRREVNSFGKEDYSGNLYAHCPSEKTYKVFTASIKGNYATQRDDVMKLLSGESCVFRVFKGLRFWESTSLQVQLTPLVKASRV